MPHFGPIDRRALLKASTATAAAGLLPGAALAQLSEATPVSLRFRPGAAGPAVPPDFVGLSYETEQLERPDFFSAENTDLVRAFRGLSAGGVLRLGGNTSEFSWWKARPDEAPPPRRASRTLNGEPPASTLYAVTPQAIEALSGFLQATGWTCIYGLNLGNGVPDNLAREAAFVSRTLKERLFAFTIGNEPDLYGKHLRDPATWGFSAYLQDWLAAANAVQRAAPEARFIMPEVANAVDWLTDAAQAWPGLSAPPRLQALSHHYYFGGPPSNPKVNIERLLQPDPRVVKEGEIARAAAERLGVRHRVTEANTCYHGGKPGVSDVFASALWDADYFLTLMTLGYSGAHLHGGSGHAVATSVGGHLEGEAVLPDNAPRPRPFYTPIATIDGRIEPQPDYYGMKFAGLFAGGTLIPVEVEAAGANVTAYAARQGRGVFVAVINKDAARDVRVALPSHRIVATLTGPALDSRTANLALHGPEPPAASGALIVPRASAAIAVLND